MAEEDRLNEQGVKKAHEDLEHALLVNDGDWLEANMTPDALFVHMDGRVETADVFIEHLRAGTVRSLSRETGDLRIRLFDKTAVVTCWSRIHIDGASGEKRLSMRITRVFVYRAGRWVFVTNQSGANTADQSD